VFIVWSRANQVPASPTLFSTSTEAFAWRAGRPDPAAREMRICQIVAAAPGSTAGVFVVMTKSPAPLQLVASTTFPTANDAYAWMGALAGAAVYQLVTVPPPLEWVLPAPPPIPHDPREDSFARDPIVSNYTDN